MKINRSELHKLLQLLEITAPKELNCDDFLDLMAAYSEDYLGGIATGSTYESFRHHLKLCPECTEELNAYLKVLKSELRG